MKQQISKEQMTDWLENPVTILFKDQMIHERDEILERRGLDAYHPFDAGRTQETLANLNGYADALDRQIALLEGEDDWEADDEQ